MTAKMSFYAMPDLICAECGIILCPVMDTLQGSIVLHGDRIDYRHPGRPRCSNSELVIRVSLGALGGGGPLGVPFTADVIGRTYPLSRQARP